MSSTALITGTSSGIGRATAKLFASNGWNVVATMRNPDGEADRDDPPSPSVDGVMVARLDVTDLDSIAAAVEAGTERFGGIDVLVNNAGYGAYGALESTPREKIVRQFDTNVIGLFDVTKAVLPQMRERRSGTIVNVSSMGGKITLPLGSLYHGTKFAVEGLSEALSYELAAIGVKMKIIEPGIITTDFSGRSFDLTVDPELSEYMPVVQGVIAASQAERVTSPPELVAEVILDAVTDGSDQLRYIAGADAEQIIAIRQASDDATYLAGMKQTYGL